MKAMTNIMRNNQLISISNKLIAEDIASKLKVSSNITNNPYFIYRLFDIFKIDGKCIESVLVYKDKIVIKTSYYEYEIVLNSANGLTVIIDDESNDHENIYYKSRRIIEVIPVESGMLIISHKNIVTGSLADFNCYVTKDLRVEHVDKDGIATSKEDISIESFKKGGLFSYKIDIEPCTMGEYQILINKYRETKEGNYSYLFRKSLNEICIRRQFKEDTNEENKSFSSNDILDIIDLRECNYKANGYDLSKVANKLINFNAHSSVEAQLANNLGNRLGINLNKQCNDTTDKDRKLARAILNPSKELKKDF